MTTYTHILDLAKEAEPPADGILSKTIYQDDQIKAVAFGFGLVHGFGFASVLADLGLPQGNGLDVLRELRGRGDATPVIVLTARDGPGDRVAGLDAGADDYLVKPFSFIHSMFLS